MRARMLGATLAATAVIAGVTLPAFAGTPASSGWSAHVASKAGAAALHTSSKHTYTVTYVVRNDDSGQRPVVSYSTTYDGRTGRAIPVQAPWKKTVKITSPDGALDVTLWAVNESTDHHGTRISVQMLVDGKAVGSAWEAGYAAHPHVDFYNGQ